MSGPVLGTIPGKGYYSEAARAQRLDWLRAHSGAPLDSLDGGGVDPDRLTGNIENFVAVVEIPVGLAGPLVFHGEHARGEIVAPLATTEGALVASASRGARAISACGGVTTKVLAQRMSRAPVWEFADIATACRFVKWISEQRAVMDRLVTTVSQHATIIDVDPYQIGRFVHVRFDYRTGAAAGQNMTTVATWTVCRWLNDRLADEQGIRPEMFLIEGNLAGDKKLTYLSLAVGRGSRVTAECTLDEETVETVLKVKPEMIVRAHRAALLGGQQAGMIGNSINAANVIAAIFLSTGQDMACVHESGTALFSMALTGEGLHATILLPNLVLGTVGGGTGLPNQQDFLAATGCSGEDGSARLAEIIAGFALALDLSTAAAVTGGQFAVAHQRLGRSRRVNPLRQAEIDADFLQRVIASRLGLGRTVTEVVAQSAPAGSGLVSELAARAGRGKFVGLLPLRLVHTGSGGPATELEVMVKSKALDREILLEASKVASLCGTSVAEAWHRWGEFTELKDCHLRELWAYRAPDPALRALLPRVYGVHENPEREIYLVVMERLDRAAHLLDVDGEPTGWTACDVDTALRGIATVHGRWLGRQRELLDAGWLGHVPGPTLVDKTRELWIRLADHNAKEHPDLLPPRMKALVWKLAEESGTWTSELEAMPMTLVHNDFSPRNVALRKVDAQPVAFDWELATVHVPQRDFVELLAFTLGHDSGAAEVRRHLDVHRAAVEAASGRSLSAAQWR
ncbi:MAG TPA: phosphotransferase, partial [Pseudonocardiaceae bacterium]|nr:phosphotransferase [Pseudonocardiaceae bacterium]